MYVERFQSMTIIYLAFFRNQEFQHLIKEFKEKTQELKGVKEGLKVRSFVLTSLISRF